MNARKFFCIENEFETPRDVELFVEKHPDLVFSLRCEYGCIGRSFDSLQNTIVKHDALIIQSTFMYVEQLESYVEGFRRMQLPAGFQFYVVYLKMKLQEWSTDNRFGNKEKFISNLTWLMDNYEVYSISSIDYTFEKLDSSLLNK